MREQHYYIIASLPYLSVDVKPLIGSKTILTEVNDFLANCKNYLKRTDFEMLESVSLFEKEENDLLPCVIRHFFRWERGVRNVLARLRAKSFGLGPDEIISDEIVDYLKRTDSQSIPCRGGFQCEFSSNS